MGWDLCRDWHGFYNGNHGRAPAGDPGPEPARGAQEALPFPHHHSHGLVGEGAMVIHLPWFPLGGAVATQVSNTEGQSLHTLNLGGPWVLITCERKSGLQSSHPKMLPCTPHIAPSSACGHAGSLSADPWSCLVGSPTLSTAPLLCFYGWVGTWFLWFSLFLLTLLSYSHLFMPVRRLSLGEQGCGGQPTTAYGT